MNAISYLQKKYIYFLFTLFSFYAYPAFVYAQDDSPTSVIPYTNEQIKDAALFIHECCDDLADDIFDTQSILIACCKQTQSNFEHTFSLIENLTHTVTVCCAQTQSNFEFTWSLIEQICTGSGAFCCDEILFTLSRDFAITWSKIDACCNTTQSSFEHTWSLIEDLIHTVTGCCAQTQSSFEHTFSLIDNLTHTVTACCAQTQSNFEFTWSLIQHMCTGSGTVFCCDEILKTLSRDFNITWSKIDACCLESQSNFEFTWSLIGDLTHTVTACCAQTQSNFEFTWSLIQHMCTGSGTVFCCDEILKTLSRDFNITWSKIDACCLVSQSNFEHTWSLIGDLTHTVTACCEQTQSNFNHTFSLLEDLTHTVTACCAQTQSNFEFTWSLIQHMCTGSGTVFCCNEILTTLSRDFAITWSKIDACCLQTQSNFEHTWSLITACCLQTQSNFEHTWSLIESICTGSGAFCCNEILTTLSRDFAITWSKIDACCLQTQSNFEHTWSLITACCLQTQSNFEHTWSLIENLCTGSGGGINCCNEIVQSLSQIRCSLGCFADCALCNNQCELCSLTGTCVANCPNCPTFKNASDGISTVFCEVKAVEKLINDKFDELFEILSKIFCRLNCGCS